MATSPRKPSHSFRPVLLAHNTLCSFSDFAIFTILLRSLVLLRTAPPPSCSRVEEEATLHFCCLYSVPPTIGYIRPVSDYSGFWLVCVAILSLTTTMPHLSCVRSSVYDWPWLISRSCVQTISSVWPWLIFHFIIFLHLQSGHQLGTIPAVVTWEFSCSKVRTPLQGFRVKDTGFLRLHNLG